MNNCKFFVLLSAMIIGCSFLSVPEGVSKLLPTKDKPQAAAKKKAPEPVSNPEIPVPVEVAAADKKEPKSGGSVMDYIKGACIIGVFLLGALIVVNAKRKRALTPTKGKIVAKKKVTKKKKTS